MNERNFEIIGMRLKGNVSENARIIIQNFNPELLRNFITNDAKELACYAHLGYLTADEVGPLVRQGADWSVKYFEKGDTKLYGWFDALARGLLLCLLIGERDQLVTLCSWSNPKTVPDYNPVLPNEFQLFYLCLASLFQKMPATDFGAVFEKVAACRNKEVRLLSKALTSIKQREQAAFEKAILDCVEHHKTKPKPASDAYFMEDWLPLHVNTIFLAGLQLGLTRPDYPPNVTAYLMTPESVGFGK